MSDLACSERLIVLTAVILIPRLAFAGGWDSLEEQWTIDTQMERIEATVTARFSGKPGEVLPLLRAPAVLTGFSGEGLVLRKKAGNDGSSGYTVAIPSAEPSPDGGRLIAREIAFSYQLAFPEPRNGVRVPTSGAAFHVVTALADQGREEWEIASPSAAKTSRQGPFVTLMFVAASDHLISLRPKKRDPSNEKTEFFAESQQLFVPSPGVIDGAHRFEIRTAQGLVRALRYRIPPGFTVSDVLGPVDSWQFDPEKTSLAVEISPLQSETFSLTIQTQAALGAFPAEAKLGPLWVEESSGQTGMLGLAFGEDAKPETLTPENLIPLNLEDFDSRLVQEKSAVLHRAFRFSQPAASLSARVIEVSPEIRIVSKQVLSLGDDNLVWNVNFAADIARAGIFQLGLRIPSAFEVNSLSGDGMKNWTEALDAGGETRAVTIHFDGKSMGRREFALSLAAAAPSRETAWNLPRFTVAEANRQTGELIVQPATGLRLSPVERSNVSEADPRDLGAREIGSLAFRLLQKDWSVSVTIETLLPRLTGDLLHEISLRESRVRSALIGRFIVENAAVRSLLVQLPDIDVETSKTLLASGSAVREIAKIEGQPGMYEIRLKRWLTGSLDVRIEWEKRAAPPDGEFPQSPVTFPEARQLRYFFAARSSGRIETVLSKRVQPWRRVDWSSVPKVLREGGNRIAPRLVVKAPSAPGDLFLKLERHSLAEALKLRMNRCFLQTVLSPRGARLTSASLEIEVIQRGYLTFTLPPGSVLFCLSVNGEPIAPVKQNSTVWQFSVQPGANGRQAQVSALYLEPGKSLGRIDVTAPLFDLPVENLTWEILSPNGIEMTSHAGDLNYLGRQATGEWDRTSYLEIARSRRQQQSQEAVALLDQANRLLQAGQLDPARQALRNVSNRSGLDAASHEDARVQLQTLQARQALVGINSRRQRIYLDRSPEDGPGGEQLRESASRNAVLQKGDLNFRPDDLSQLLQGNPPGDLAAFRKIAARIVEQQQGAGERTSPGLDIEPPQESNRYRFGRSVQVSGDAPITLRLNFAPKDRPAGWRWLTAVALILALALALVWGRSTTR